MITIDAKKITLEKYWILTNYDMEGWKITLKTDDWNEAVKAREESLLNGNFEVVIVQPIPLIIKDGRYEGNS